MRRPSPLPPRRQEAVELLDKPSNLSVRQRRIKGTKENQSCQRNKKHRKTRRDASPYFGDAPAEVPDDWFRVGCINVDNLAPYISDEKDERLCSDMHEYEIEALLVQEVGVNWALVDRKRQWIKRNKWNFEPDSVQAKFGFNEHDITREARQWGGTGVISQGKLKHYAMGAGVDKTGLGRWTWARYRGKGDVVFRVVSIYQPCRNTNGTVAVYAQQKCYLQEHNDDRDPRTAFKEDFAAELAEWIDQGDQVLVGGDINQEVSDDEIQAIFAEHDMQNIMLEAHGTHHNKPTYYRTESDRVVDGMWATPGVIIQRCGYLEPKDFSGNHSLLWADISYDDALGHNPPQPTAPTARRLQLRYEEVTKRYLDIYEKEILKYNLPARQFYLESTCRYGVPLTPEQQQEAEAIDILRTRCMLKAERKCRKLRMGRVNFSPAVNEILKTLAFWDVAIARREVEEPSNKGKRKKKRKVSSRLWRRKKHAAGVRILTKYMSISEMEEHRKTAKEKYHEAKKQHRDLRLSFLDTLDSKTKQKLKRHEKQREMGRLAKAITGKLESKSVTKVELDGIEYTTKLDGIEYTTELLPCPVL